MDWDLEIVVTAVDGSEQALHAAQVAASLARRHDAKLYVITVIRPPEGWWGIGGAPPPPESLSKAVADAQREVLDRTMEAIDTEGVTTETIAELGDPASAIFTFCGEVNADVLVIGRRGAGLLERVVLGSVADRLVHYAPCPTLVVP